MRWLVITAVMTLCSTAHSVQQRCVDGQCKVNMTITGQITPTYLASVDLYMPNARVGDIYIVEVRGEPLHMEGNRIIMDRFVVVGDIRKTAVAFHDTHATMHYPQSVLVLHWEAREAQELMAILNKRWLPTAILAKRFKRWKAKKGS